MKIVIDITSEDFEKVKCGRGAVSMMRKAIMHGTPLPDGAEILTKEAYSDLCARAADVPGTNAGELIRQAAIVALANNRCGNDEWDLAVTNDVETVKKLPSVEPERKTGKWVHMVGWWECNQCHAEYTDMPTCMGKVIYEYCPMCGAKMEVEK